MIRLDKFLCDCNIGTRTEVKKLIKTKQIQVNGELALKPEMKIDEQKDEVLYRGKQVVYEKYTYYLFHKPAGCVTANKDNLHKTVMDYFSEEIQKEHSPVGRLDLDTEGLLLITNDGALAHHLISPSHHVPKVYYAKLDKIPDPKLVEEFAKGVDIGDDILTLPAKLTILSDEEDKFTNEIELEIVEGRFHQVKRMFEAYGCHVIYLKRLSMGSLQLGELSKGKYRKLNQQEIEELLSS